MKDIIGDIVKEDQQAAFELVCERTGHNPDDVKGVGYIQRIIKLCTLAKLSFTLDYSKDKFTIGNVPESAPEAETTEEVMQEEDNTPSEQASNEPPESSVEDDDDPFED